MPWGINIRENQGGAEKSKVTEKEATDALQTMKNQLHTITYNRDARAFAERHWQGADRKQVLTTLLHSEQSAAVSYDDAQELVERFMRETGKTVFQAEGFIVTRNINNVDFFSKVE